MTPSVPKRAAIYTPISDDREGMAAGVARQLKDCRALAKSRGWNVAEVYPDNNKSAYSGKHHRPEYERLIDDIRERRVDGLIVWHLDRLHRSPLELEHFLEVCDKAKLSADDMSRRILLKHQGLADTGQPSGGGTRPFGYQKAPRRVPGAPTQAQAINAPEAALIRKAAQRVLLGDSLRAVCRDWNASGVRTTTARSGGPTC